jgi:hypothetical protein
VAVPLGLAPRPRAPRRAGLLALLPRLAGPGGWALAGVGLVCAFVVLPPYPYLLTALGDGEFRLQLLVGALALAGVVVVLYLPYELNALLQLVVPIVGALAAITALLSLRPAANGVLNAVWPLGMGVPLLVGALAWLALGGLRRLFGPRP